MNKKKVIRPSETILVLFVLAVSVWTLPAQNALTVWPGDVNDNGEVNAVDVLWWSVAQNERGPRRGREDSLWAAQTVEPWQGAFPNGLNHAYADCDGNGVINEADLRIIRRNFGLERPGNIPDIFTVGIPGQDPLLSLRATRGPVKRGETLPVEVSLGDAGIPAEQFFGFAFTIPYNPAVTGRRPNAARFELAANSWIGRRNADVKEFVFDDAETGKTHTAIYRTRKEEVPEGGGPIGTYSIIIIDDIVSGITTVDLGLEDVKLVDFNLTDEPVAVDTVAVPIEQTTSRGDVLPDTDPRLRVFPNPVYDLVTVEWTGQSGQLQRVEVFNLLGQPLPVVNLTGDRRQVIDLSAYPPGLYLLRIHTSEGVATRSVTK